MLRNLKSNSEGAVAIEFVIMMPFLFMLLYGVYTISNNIMLSRKFDNAVNDVSYIVSRLGRIANSNVDAQGNCPATGCEGGKDTLEKSVNYLMPLMLYPLDFKEGDTEAVRGKYAYDIDIMYLGLPVITTNDPSVPKTVMRMMWKHKIKSPNNLDVSTNAAVCNPLKGSTTINGVPYETSTFRAKFGFNSGGLSSGYGQTKNIATAVFPGQSFIVSSGYLAKNYGPRRRVILPGDNQGSSSILFNFGTFEKFSAYSVRSSWRDSNGNGSVDPNEFFNEMHYCTDCGPPNNASLWYKSQGNYFSRDASETDPNRCATTAGGGDNGYNSFNVYKARCIPDTAGLNGNGRLTSTEPGYTSSGCKFN